MTSDSSFPTLMRGTEFGVPRLPPGALFPSIFNFVFICTRDLWCPFLWNFKFACLVGVGGSLLILTIIGKSCLSRIFEMGHSLCSSQSLRRLKKKKKASETITVGNWKQLLPTFLPEEASIFHSVLFCTLFYLSLYCHLNVLFMWVLSL